MGGLKTELTRFEAGFVDLGIDFDLVIEGYAFFSIDTLINTIAVFEVQGVDIANVDFIQESGFKCI